jgi:hypothetical protein
MGRGLSKTVAAGLASLALAAALAAASTPASAGWRHYSYGYDYPLWPGYYWHPPYSYDDAGVPILGPLLGGIVAITRGTPYYDPPHAYYWPHTQYYGAGPYSGYSGWR